MDSAVGLDGVGGGKQDIEELLGTVRNCRVVVYVLFLLLLLPSLASDEEKR